MRFTKTCQQILISTAVVGMLLPTGILHADEMPAPKTVAEVNRVVDVALDAKDRLRGTLVDNAGKPIEGINVFLSREGRIIAAGQSNKDGKFAIANLIGGSYRISAGDRAVNIRCWAASTAPPNAVRSTLVQVEDVQRGQVHPGTCLLANPWIVAGVAATAVFVPIAIKNIRDNRDDDSRAEGVVDTNAS